MTLSLSIALILHPFYIPLAVTIIEKAVLRKDGASKFTYGESKPTIIDASTFENCKNLTTIEIPASVIVIREAAFARLGSTTLKFAPELILKEIQHNALAECQNLTSIDIPASVTIIADTTFENSGISFVSVL